MSKGFLLKSFYIFLETIGLFFAATIVVFFFINLLPSKVYNYDINSLTPDEIERVKRDTGYYDPFIIKYKKYLQETYEMLTDPTDYGTSSKAKLFYSTKITVLLTIGSIMICILLGVPVGLMSSIFENSKVIKLLNFLLYAVSMLPIFLLGYFVQLFFIKEFKILPVLSDLEESSFLLKSIVALFYIGILAIGDGTISEIIRHVREELSGILRSDHIRAVKANGGKVWFHILKNVLVPIFTIINLRILYLLGGAVVVEFVFNLQGLGYLAWKCVADRDYNLLFAVTVINVVMVLLITTFNKMLITIVDPRARN